MVEGDLSNIWQSLFVNGLLSSSRKSGIVLLRSVAYSSYIFSFGEKNGELYQLATFLRKLHLLSESAVTFLARALPLLLLDATLNNKPNLTSYVRGQCWASLAATFKRSETEAIETPLLSRLMPNAGNTGKLIVAKMLIRAVFRLFENQTVRVLVDSWYMRRVFIDKMNCYGYSVSGQARIDARLYDEQTPKKPGQREANRANMVTSTRPSGLPTSRKRRRL